MKESLKSVKKVHFSDQVNTLYVEENEPSLMDSESSEDEYSNSDFEESCSEYETSHNEEENQVYFDSFHEKKDPVNEEITENESKSSMDFVQTDLTNNDKESDIENFETQQSEKDYMNMAKSNEAVAFSVNCELATQDSILNCCDKCTYSDENKTVLEAENDDPVNTSICNFHNDTTKSEIKNSTDDINLNDNLIQKNACDLFSLSSYVENLSINALEKFTCSSNENGFADKNLNEAAMRRFLTSKKRTPVPQTKKLNSILMKRFFELNSSEIKTVVFQSWCSVKKGFEEAYKEQHNITNFSIMKHTLRPKASEHAFKTWTKSKRKKRAKSFLNTRSSEVGMSKTENEDNGMAFILWKNEKDNILKEQTRAENERQQRSSMESLMKTEEQKNNAKGAFIAWMSHKTELIKFEKEKKKNLLRDDLEKTTNKTLKDKEALEMYQEWLKKKHSKKTARHKLKLKSPWCPPGNANFE